MSSETVGRVLARVKELGMNPRSASVAAGLGATFIRDMVKRPGSSPSFRNMQKLAAALQTTVEELTGSPEANREADAGGSTEPINGRLPGLRDDFVLATYGGIAEATAFRPGDDIVDPDRGPELVARDDRYPRGDYVIFDVVGDSMNAADPPIPAGAQVIAIRTDNPFRHVALQTGDLVVVKRTKEQGGLIELSVKELELGEKETRYLPRSKNKRHQPIVVPKDLHADDETTVEVVGLIINVTMKVRRR